jgi:hypothetical protein
LKVVARSACKIPFGRLEFASERSGGISPLKCSKGGRYQNHLVKVKFRWKDAKSFLPEILEEEWMNGRDTLWRSVEITWTVGSHRSMRRLRMSVF